jgi:hypothetical protein
MRVYALALILMFPFPWFHKKQNGFVHVGLDGRAVVVFSHHFSRHPSCAAVSRDTGRSAQIVAWSREAVEFRGKPGEVLKWSCRHNPKGVR